jgi:allophanate hydrolase subunit 2
LQCEQETLVAWCGADFAAQVGGQPLPRERAVRVAAGEIITFGLARSGLRAWLAFAGELMCRWCWAAAVPIAGPASADMKAGLSWRGTV